MENTVLYHTDALNELVLYLSAGAASAARQLQAEDKALPEDFYARLESWLASADTDLSTDDAVLLNRITEILSCRDRLVSQLSDPSSLPAAAQWSADSREINEKAQALFGDAPVRDNAESLKRLIRSALIGIASYLFRARALMSVNAEADQFMLETLARMLDEHADLGDLLEMMQESGRVSLDAMALLDMADTAAYGNPEITRVETGVRNQPAILISGSDFSDLAQLLEQTENAGVDVYSYGEMLPARAYPLFKKYKNFAGSYGGSWWRQRDEFEQFGGPILISDAIVQPKESYRNRLWATGLASAQGVQRIEADENGHKDFSPLIEQARSCPAPSSAEDGYLVTGFAHAQVEGLADLIVDSVQSGAIRKFVVIAGSDGRERSREYYTEFVRGLPQGTVVLAAGSSKFRYNKLKLGDILGIPRILDAGQMSDLYSITLIANKFRQLLSLKEVNDLPFIYQIALHNRSDIAGLLALLYLGVKDIHIGPELPACLTPDMVRLLKEQYGASLIGSTAKEDLETLFAGGEAESFKGKMAITGNMLMGDIVRQYPDVIPLLMSCGLHCISCGSSAYETLEEACAVHGIPVDEILEMIDHEFGLAGENM